MTDVRRLPQQPGVVSYHRKGRIRLTRGALRSHLDAIVAKREGAGGQGLTPDTPRNSFPTSGFTTLPSAFRGRASTTERARGTLYGARRCFAHAWSSGRVSWDPGTSSTAAHTRSPHSASSTPTTAHSATAACVRSTSSISSAEIL